MSWTTPRTWVPGELATASMLNTHVRDNLNALHDGATSGRIAFPATENPSADANTLDDYEEGLWTPTIGGSGGQTGQAYTTQFGSYVKIGQLVYANFNILLSTLGTITGTAQIKGLPFPSANLSASSFAVSPVVWGGTTATFVNLWALVLNNAAVASIVGVKTAANTNANVVQGDFASTTNLIGTLIYRAGA